MDRPGTTHYQSFFASFLSNAVRSLSAVGRAGAHARAATHRRSGDAGDKKRAPSPAAAIPDSELPHPRIGNAQGAGIAWRRGRSG